MFGYGGLVKCNFFSDGEYGLEEEAMYPLNEISVYIFCAKQACEKFIQMNNNSSWWYDIGENFDVKSS